MRRVPTSLASSAIAALLLWSTPAWAPFHIVVIDQIFFGSADCPNAQYVMLRTLAAGQIFVNGQHVPTQNADGSTAGEFGAFDHNLDNGASGVPILMGTSDAQTLFGLPMDQEVSGHLVFADGRVCFGNFGGPVDCVAYGSFSGDNGSFGQAAVQPELGMALVRQRDTSPKNNSTDFALGAPAPRNNAGQSGTLGTCGGVAPSPTPTVPPNPTPTLTPGTSPACVGDCDGTGMVTVGEIIKGVNIVLGNAQLSTCPAIDANGNGEVAINELIAAVNALLNGCSPAA